MDTKYQASLSREVDWFIASYSFSVSSSWLMHGKLIIIYTCFEKGSLGDCRNFEGFYTHPKF